MKKILSAIVACVLILSAVLFTSCDDISENDIISELGGSSASSDTETAKDTETTEPDEPVKVDSINGKNARQLFEKFYEELKSLKSCDMSVSEMSSENGKLVTETMEIKRNNDSSYIYMSGKDGYMKVWIIGGMAYVDMNGQKLKTNDVTEIFEENLFDSFVSEVMTEVPEMYLKKLESAQLYSYNGEYYCTVKISAKENEQMTGESEAYEDTIYFGADGSVKRTVSISEDGSTITTNIKSVGKPVTITKPADADSYYEKGGSTGAGDQDPEVYAIYDELCDIIGEMSVYTMYVDLDSTEYAMVAGYEVDRKGNKYLGVVMDGVTSEMWYVGGVAYVSQNNSQPQRTQYDQDMKESIDSIAGMKDSISDNRIDGNLMSGLTYEKISATEYTLSFSVRGSETFVDYTFFFDASYSYITVYVEVGSENTVEQSMVYEFNSINDPALEVVAPI